MQRSVHDSHFGRLESPSWNADMDILRRWPTEAIPSVLEKNKRMKLKMIKRIPSFDVFGGVAETTKLMQSQKTLLDPRPKGEKMT